MSNDSNSGYAMYIAVETFVAQYDGADILVTQDHTRVDGGHELVKRFPHMFKPIEAHYRVEQATAAPGERRA